MKHFTIIINSLTFVNWPQPYGSHVDFMFGSNGYVSAGVRSPCRNTCTIFKINSVKFNITKRVLYVMILLRDVLIYNVWITCTINLKSSDQSHQYRIQERNTIQLIRVRQALCNGKKRNKVTYQCRQLTHKHERGLNELRIHTVI